MPSGLSHGRSTGGARAMPRPAAARRSFGTLMPAPPGPVEERQRVDAHRARVVGASRAGLPATITHGAPASRSAAAAAAPHSAYAASVPARQTTGWPSYAATRSLDVSVGPATSTATPPAASRLEANVARAVCAATVPIVARKTGSAGGLVAQRLEGGAVAAHVRSRAGPARARAAPRRGSGTRSRRSAAAPGGDLRVALGARSPRPAASRSSPLARAGRTAPRRRRRGRR